MGTDKRERQKANRQLRLEQIAKEQQKQKRKRLGRTIGLFVVLAVGVTALFWLLGRKNDDQTETQDTAAVTTVVDATAATNAAVSTTAAGEPATTVAFAYGTGECAKADGSSPKTQDFTEAPALCIDPAKTYTATVETNKGEFTIALDTANAPGNVNNFVNLARFQYYDDTKCHRIIENFVVQCGRPGDESAEEKPGYTVPDEVPTRPYKIGDIAMANTGAPNTGGGQFFIITGDDGASLPSQYSLVGSVTSGMDDTVAAMAAAADPTAANGVPPKEDIVIKKVTISES